jgi:hypothetical protein
MAASLNDIVAALMAMQVGERAREEAERAKVD